MREIRMRQAINEALHEEMSRDERVFLMGESITLDSWATHDGLFEKFGKSRVRETSISESTIAGAAVGAALAGYRPIAHMMFCDFMTIAADEVLGRAGKWRFCSGGKVSVPIVIRAACGGYSKLGADHSQTTEGLIMHAPGLKLVLPTTPYDAKGLLKTAIRDNNPVIFFEHKSMLGNIGPVPEEEYTIPLGVADIKRTGKDVTVVATGYMVYLSLQIAEILQQDYGVSVEVVDPRTLEPLDIGTIVSSVKKTKHVVLVDEDVISCGPTAEIGMQIMERAFDFLDAPIKRVAAKQFPIAGAYMEQFVLPSPQGIADGIAEVLGTKGLDLKGRVVVKGREVRK